MKDIIFVKTRYNYQSYTDFWRLVELSGYSTIYVDQLHPSDPDTVYIVCPMNGEYRPHMDNFGLDNIKSRIYLWNIERPNGVGSLENVKPGDYTRDNRELIDRGYVKDIIVSDRMLAYRTGFIYIPVGIHPDLGSPGSKDSKRYNAIHLMCPSHNRAMWFDGNTVQRKVVNGLYIAPNSWGDERDANLKASYFMINVHQDGEGWIEPLRFTLAAAYGLVIVSTYSYNFYPYNACDGVIECDMSLTALQRILKYEDVYEKGLAFRESMLKFYQFRDMLEAADL